MDSYEILKRQSTDASPEGSTTHSPSIEDLGAELASSADQSIACDVDKPEEDYEFASNLDRQDEEEENLDSSATNEEEPNEEVVIEDNKSEELHEEHPDLRKRMPHEQAVS